MDGIKTDRWTWLGRALLAVYLAALVWILLFKMELDLQTLAQMDLRQVNLIPFAQPLRVNGQADYSEAVQNAAAFLPFGLLLAAACPHWTGRRSIACMAGVSLAIEGLQYVLAIGTSDVTDLLMNTLGGVCGLALYAGLTRVLGSRARKGVLLLALVGGSALLLLVLVLLIAN